jgi:hypothetical protein
VNTGKVAVGAVIAVIGFWLFFMAWVILSTKNAKGVRLVPNIPYVEGTPGLKRIDLENLSSHRLRMGMNNHGILDAICDDCTNAGDVECERSMNVITCKDKK